MECKQSQALLSAWLDGELPAAQHEQMQAHLRGCAACRAALAELEALHGRMRAEASYHAAPEHLRQRIHTALRAERAEQAHTPLHTATTAAPTRPAKPAAPRRAGLRAWPWTWINLGLAGASAAAFAVTLTLYLGQPSASELLERELVASHYRALMPDHLADVASSDQHTVKPWFAGKLDFSPPVYDLAPQGYALIGGRLDYLQQRPVAALAYRHRQHVLDLYIWPDAASVDTPPHASNRQGFHLLRWSQDGMRFSAISDMNPQDLVYFARQLHDKVAVSAAQ